MLLLKHTVQKVIAQDFLPATLQMPAIATSMSFVASYASIIPIPPSSRPQSRSSLALDTDNGENAKTHHRLADWLKQKARLKPSRHHQAPQESASMPEPEKIEAVPTPTPTYATTEKATRKADNCFGLSCFGHPSTRRDRRPTPYVYTWQTTEADSMRPSRASSRVSRGPSKRMIVQNV